MKLNGFMFESEIKEKAEEKLESNRADIPAQHKALSYIQGNQVYTDPMQEKHQEHEIGHVVQQKQGRVRPKL